MATERPLVVLAGAIHPDGKALLEKEARRGVRPYAIDPAIAEKLWAESVRLTGTDLL